MRGEQGPNTCSARYFDHKRPHMICIASRVFLNLLLSQLEICVKQNRLMYSLFIYSQNEDVSSVWDAATTAAISGFSLIA